MKEKTWQDVREENIKKYSKLTVQELIDKLLQVQDKNKKIIFHDNNNTFEFSSDAYNAYISEPLDKDYVSVDIVDF
ncbi:hypothetical protein FUSO7_10020 [Fusobacterium necrophorum BFTR-2]|nr:hypothetical protein [Fusobacterium necrophorum]KDE71173.1 hypothetical protein FUSO7_10020 [Fusobacterium necrophorum BFTR-2]MDY2573570.1 hypothetical protein [Fusobacterium necrophorum]